MLVLVGAAWLDESPGSHSISKSGSCSDINERTLGQRRSGALLVCVPVEFCMCRACVASEVYGGSCTDHDMHDM